MCKNTNDCPAGQNCRGGVCTATARGTAGRAIWLCAVVGLAIAVILARAGHAEEKKEATEVPSKKTPPLVDWKTGRTLRSVCDFDCDEANKAASASASECSAARTACVNAKASEKKSCINGCNVAQARNAAECANNDPDPACFVATRSVCAECVTGCNAATYSPSECTSVAETCAAADAQRTAAVRACKC